jgi:hypothetical protein
VCETGLARFPDEARRYKLVQQIERRAQRCRAKARLACDQSVISCPPAAWSPPGHPAQPARSCGKVRYRRNGAARPGTTAPRRDAPGYRYRRNRSVLSHRTWPAGTSLTCGGPDWLRRRPAGCLTEVGLRWPFSRGRHAQSAPAWAHLSAAPIPSMVSHHLVYSIRIVVNAVGVWCGRPWDTTGSGAKGLGQGSAVAFRRP